MMNAVIKARELASLSQQTLALMLGAIPGVDPEEVQMKLPVPQADHRIFYGDSECSFGDLRLPKRKGPGLHPVVVVIHGGCWKSEHDLEHIGHLCARLADLGIATWSLEYRRLGDVGGGWPGTFMDVGRGTDYLQTLAERFPLDLDRVAFVGHSSGGQLALWLASRHKIGCTNPLFSTTPLAARGVMALAPISDLYTYGATPGSCNDAVAMLLEGGPDQVPERYVQASPIALLPLGVPQYIVHGSVDTVVPVGHSIHYATRAKHEGDDVKFHLIDGAGHFDVIAPFTDAWKEVEGALRTMLMV
jgi:acetyl esterase/lipase